MSKTFSPQGTRGAHTEKTISGVNAFVGVIYSHAGATVYVRRANKFTPTARTHQQPSTFLCAAAVQAFKS